MAVRCLYRPPHVAASSAPLNCQRAKLDEYAVDKDQQVAQTLYLADSLVRHCSIADVVVPIQGHRWYRFLLPLAGSDVRRQ